MKLFEYQAKEAFRQKGLPTPEGVLIHGMGELDDALARTGFPCVLKAQVLRGGRGICPCPGGPEPLLKPARHYAIMKAVF